MEFVSTRFIDQCSVLYPLSNEGPATADWCALFTVKYDDTEQTHSFFDRYSGRPTIKDTSDPRRRQSQVSNRRGEDIDLVSQSCPTIQMKNDVAEATIFT